MSQKSKVPSRSAGRNGKADSTDPLPGTSAPAEADHEATPTPADNGESEADFGGVDPAETPAIVQAPPADDEDDDFSAFDVESMLATPITGEDLGEKVAVLRLPVRKPRSAVDYFRAHPDEAYRREVMLLEVKRKDTYSPDYYVLDRQIHDEVRGRKGVAVFTVALAMSFEGELFLWPIRRASGPARSLCEQDLADAIRRSFTDWVQVVWLREKFRWEIWRYTGKLPAEPVWPTEPFTKILKRSFEGRCISDPNHELLCEKKEKVS
jgi:hypothetical protein